MDKQEKLDKIYKVIANKELAFGCKTTDLFYKKKWKCIWFIDNPWEFECIISYDDGTYHNEDMSDIRNHIIGHPVMIGDIWQYFYENMKSQVEFDMIDFMIDEWKNKRWPIDDEDKCIDYIFNLL